MNASGVTLVGRAFAGSAVAGRLGSSTWRYDTDFGAWT